MKKNSQQQSTQLQVRYSETSSLYCSQFLVNSTSEDITLGFSSGYIQDPGSGDTSLPIHTRISMTLQGARRLQNLLAKILDEKEQGATQQADPVGEDGEGGEAQLPKM